MTDRPRPALTERQAEVAALVVDGLTYGQIAARLGCTERTVRKHVEDAAERIGGDEPQRYRLRRWWREQELAA